MDSIEEKKRKWVQGISHQRHVWNGDCNIIDNFTLVHKIDLGNYDLLQKIITIVAQLHVLKLGIYWWQGDKGEINSQKTWEVLLHQEWVQCWLRHLIMKKMLKTNQGTQSDSKNETMGNNEDKDDHDEIVHDEQTKDWWIASCIYLCPVLSRCSWFYLPVGK